MKYTNFIVCRWLKRVATDRERFRNLFLLPLLLVPVHYIPHHHFVTLFLVFRSLHIYKNVCVCAFTFYSTLSIARQEVQQFLNPHLIQYPFYFIPFLYPIPSIQRLKSQSQLLKRHLKSERRSFKWKTKEEEEENFLLHPHLYPHLFSQILLLQVQIEGKKENIVLSDIWLVEESWRVVQVSSSSSLNHWKDDKKTVIQFFPLLHLQPIFFIPLFYD